ncbi:transcription elongation factor spt6 [Xylona heveae TC161]|uniref:Transcription elongation factor Spt6 n=1 Tax=Xylona heveae (strain CBS 132557 / TC161) TaxID=1328760 RepID=A0A164ZEH3_XYLHT|nr:transcription elongation factor spt6 [Xylona heveae TC161]KZF18999.1 transcription elongation factor spt6 [Xylona heveae TC161]
MSTRDLIHGEAELGDEEDEESYDEETGEAREREGRKGGDRNVDDSSEEEDDEDEEAAAAVREGFIVDEDEEPEEEEERERRRRERKKRRRAEREEEEAALDEEDLDLIGEANPELERRISTAPKLKRLKRGHKAERGRETQRGVDDIFSEDEDEDAPHEYEDHRPSRVDRGGVMDEFADFIEEDDFGDEERDQEQEDLEVARPIKRGIPGVGGAQATGLDESALEDLRLAFGDGTEYDWALDQEAELEERELDPEQPLELKDVFEPSQLADKLLTDEDNEIRFADEPERFQLARKGLKHVILTDEQFREEGLWISNMMLPKKRLDSSLIDPFQKAVAKVLEFMITDEYEVPFIFQHRKDYLIHAVKVPVSPDPNNEAAPQYVVNAEKLLNQSDLWDIFDLDLKFRALIDKRNTLQKTYEGLQSISSLNDEIFEEMLPQAITMEELQDVQDYIHFQYASRLKDLATIDNSQTNGTHRRPGSQKDFFERIRNGKAYNLVRAFGISADAFARNVLREGQPTFREDPAVRPDDMADSDDVLDPSEFTTGSLALRAAKAMFAEEIVMSPRMRKVMRQTYYTSGVVNCYRTEKGLKKIDEQHPYYEFKYLRNQQFSDIARQPELYLRMMKAEDEGLVDVKVRLQNYDQFRRNLLRELESDNFSEVADAWNKLRREVLEMALLKLDKLMIRGVKENMKTECENQVARACREEFSKKLDQAPYKPKGMVLGTIPRVLALSNGAGGRDAICWAWVEEDGRVLENGKFSDLNTGDSGRNLPDGADVSAFIELVERRKPDVIAVSGYSVDTRKLFKQLELLVDEHDLRGAEYEDEDGNEKSDRLEVVMVNDEVARLYHNSERANDEHPGMAPLTRYCVAIAKYLQNPMKEYASLGSDIISISFDPSQNLVSQDKIIKQLETAMVDMVNLCGVDVNEAVGDPYTANLLPYVCGLGPRKATQLLKTINLNGGVVSTRDELVGDPEEGKLPAVGPRVWNNCASFLYIEFDSSEPSSDYLDNTRVHPEDYDLGRKMAADALELDEEDIKAEVDENGPGAIVRKLVKDEAQERVNDLILEEYAEQLERNFAQRKRATLETIRAELQQPYEELRRNFALLSTDEIFTMLTGETRDSLVEGMVVPVSIKRVTEDHIDAKLDCGIDGLVTETELTDRPDVSARQLYSIHQTVQAKVMFLNRKSLTAQLSLREKELRRPYQKQIDRMRDEWDEREEARDKEAMQEKNTITGRTQRVIKHPLFRPFNAAQAEEYLGSQARGDLVIRPSSKGYDHLAVTWKVSDNVYQHIDVLELDKENEFSVGRTLKVAGKYTYSDLDELIVNHVKAMARKVDEMMLHEKYQSGSKSETDRWLTTYAEANPKRSNYAFCINPKYPGYFYLCFKAGQHAPNNNWPVKIVPQAFELQKHQYPDMRALCNGFKLLFANMQNGKRR